ncbi:MAG: hypothetical protein LBC35_02915 [Coriobacteriales bacterium]|jgi:hypothetical protein|nr:hypothetical protein [Coriobacteriales bacterium]
MRINITDATATLKAENQGLFNEIESGLSQIAPMQTALEDPRLSGEAYTALANRLKNLRIPTMKAHVIAFSAIVDANAQNISALEALPTSSPGILDTDELDKTIDALRRKNAEITQVQAVLKKQDDIEWWLLNKYRALIELNNDTIHNLEQIKEAAFAYESFSASVYSSAQGAVSAILKGPKSSLASYLATGSLGDSSWAEDIDKAFFVAIANSYDQKMMQLSRENPDTMYLSGDYHFIFYNGKKYEINIPSSGESTDGPVMKARYNTVALLTFTFREFNVGSFLANFGNESTDVTPGQSGVAKNQGGINALNGATLISDLFDTYVKSHDETTIVFQFEEDCNGNRRVSILGNEKRFTGNYTLSQMYGSSYAKDLYEAQTGKDAELPDLAYDVHISFDEARSSEGAFTNYYFFDDNKNLQLGLIRYPQDKATITVVAGLTETIDVTDFMFTDIQGQTNKDTQNKVLENLTR